jgi:hypothetical protein
MNFQLPLIPNGIEHDHDVTGLHRTIRRGKHKRTPNSITGPDGNSLIVVPLPDGTKAILDDRDFFRLMDSGLTDQWLVNGNGRGTSYVRCRHHDRLVTIARLVTNAPDNAHVATINKECRDLRKRNLKVVTHKLRGASYNG